jgi:hypothetical protein
MGKTFAEANSDTPGYHVYKDRDTGEIWKFPLPDVCADYFNRVDNGKQVQNDTG